jgi:hypothetical protein
MRAKIKYVFDILANAPNEEQILKQIMITNEWTLYVTRS